MKRRLFPTSLCLLTLSTTAIWAAPVGAHPPEEHGADHHAVAGSSGQVAAEETLTETLAETLPVTTFSETLLAVMQLTTAATVPRPLAQLAQSSAAQNQVEIEIRDGYRYITSNGIPDHATGTFPNPGNPNQISPQSHTFRVTLTPEYTGTATPAQPAFGVALNGVPFEPGTGEFWNRDRSSGWNYDALSGKIDLGTDANNAHVQPSGSYHYHGLPTSLVSAGSMTLLGYAADGFPIYGPQGYRDADDPSSGLVDLQSSYRLKTGQRPDGPGGSYDGTFVADFEYIAGLGDLDQCNGRFGVTPDYPDGTYYYSVTDMFPFVPRCVMGTPDESFQRSGGPGGPGGSGSGRGSGNGSGGSGRRRPEGPPSGRSQGGPPPRF